MAALANPPSYLLEGTHHFADVAGGNWIFRDGILLATFANHDKQEVFNDPLLRSNELLFFKDTEAGHKERIQIRPGVNGIDLFAELRFNCTPWVFDDLWELIGPFSLHRDENSP